MSGYLENLVSRGLHPTATIQPRVVTLFGAASAVPGFTPTPLSDEETVFAEPALHRPREMAEKDATPTVASHIQLETDPSKVASPPKAAAGHSHSTILQAPPPLAHSAESLSSLHPAKKLGGAEEKSPLEPELAEKRNQTALAKDETTAAVSQSIPGRIRLGARPDEKTMPRQALLPLAMKETSPVAGRLATRVSPVRETSVKSSQRPGQIARLDGGNRFDAESKGPSSRSTLRSDAEKLDPARNIAPLFSRQDISQISVTGEQPAPADSRAVKRTGENGPLVPLLSSPRFMQSERSALPQQARESTPEPVIEVTIGRIEVRAAGVTERRQKEPSSPSLPSLEDYLRRRSVRSRHE